MGAEAVAEARKQFHRNRSSLLTSRFVRFIAPKSVLVFVQSILPGGFFKVFYALGGFAPAAVALRKRSADHFLVFLCHISKMFS